MKLDVDNLPLFVSAIVPDSIILTISRARGDVRECHLEASNGPELFYAVEDFEFSGKGISQDDERRVFSTLSVALRNEAASRGFALFVPYCKVSARFDLRTFYQRTEVYRYVGGVVVLAVAPRRIDSRGDLLKIRGEIAPWINLAEEYSKKGDK